MDLSKKFPPNDATSSISSIKIFFLKKNPWCSKCNKKHVGICTEERRCYICGKEVFLKEYPLPKGNQNMSKRTRRPILGVALSAGPTSTFKCPVNPNTFSMTQSMLQPHQVQGRLYAFTQQDVQASNTMVEGKTCLERHTI